MMREATIFGRNCRQNENPGELGLRGIELGKFLKMTVSELAKIFDQSFSAMRLREVKYCRERRI
jgi:hypothetical protein